MQTVRKADLNIMTAEWVGLASQVGPPVARAPRGACLQGSRDLDYHAARHLLYPNSGIPLHNPDREGSPVRAYLLECAGHSRRDLRANGVAVKSYDFAKRALVEEGNLDVEGEIFWGRSLKPNLKYLYLKYFT